MLVNFKVVLAARGEHQIDLALRCGVDPTLLSMVINERREASPELRAKLAATLSVSERWLFMKRTLPRRRIVDAETAPALAAAQQLYPRNADEVGNR